MGVGARAWGEKHTCMVLRSSPEPQKSCEMLCREHSQPQISSKWSIAFRIFILFILFLLHLHPLLVLIKKSSRFAPRCADEKEESGAGARE